MVPTEENQNHFSNRGGTEGYAVETIPAVLTVPEVGQFLRIGRNNAYELVRAGKIRSVRIGRKIRIPREALYEYLST